MTSVAVNNPFANKLMFITAFVLVSLSNQVVFAKTAAKKTNSRAPASVESTSSRAPASAKMSGSSASSSSKSDGKGEGLSAGEGGGSANPIVEEEIPVFQFADQELSKEAVMPRLDTPAAVINRKLNYIKRFELNAGMGWLLDEAFYNNQYLQFQGTFALNEPSSIGARLLMFGSGLSDYGKQFESSVSSQPPEFSRAHGPETGIMAFYERRAMYGKMSITKRTVKVSYVGWDIYAGMMKYGSRQLPLFGASLLNRYFVSDHFSVNLNVRAGLRQAVDPLSASLRTTTNKPAESDFSTTSKFSMMMDLGLSYLF